MSKRLNVAFRETEDVYQTPKRGSSRRITEYKQTPDCFARVALDSPLVRSKNMAVSADALNFYGKPDLSFFDIDSENSHRSTISVGVRVRPFTQRELLDNDSKCVVNMVGNETIVTTERGDKYRFTYDHSFFSYDNSEVNYASQEVVYQKLAKPLLNKVLQGYNACLFAYGQTGSGKSYSIMGHGSDVGIVPRFCGELFDRVTAEDDQADYNIEISYYEIYNEKIHDLLASTLNKEKSTKKPNLRVREHPTMGPFVDGLSTYIVKSFSDVESWLNVGNKRRATAATAVNDNSSRSHSVFTIVITKTMSSEIEGTTHKHNITSKINLVDLAGSERQAHSKTHGERLREGACINKALLTLGKVISTLSEQASNSKKTFIPYRETVLTWLLKESLGGNSKTCMLATISPSSIHVDETLSTLRYARQARNIMNEARINEDPRALLIRKLQQELEKYKMASGNDPHLWDELQLLRHELVKKDLEKDEINKCWSKKLKESEECKLEEAKSLERAGICSKMDSTTACLVNLNRDPQLNEVLYYPLKKGTTVLGREDGGSVRVKSNDKDKGYNDDIGLNNGRVGGDNVGYNNVNGGLKDFIGEVDITLTGDLIARRHCIFEHDNQDQITITSLPTASSYINGHLLDNDKAYPLHHGDRVVLGGEHFFRFVEPTKHQSSKHDHFLDFHAAFQEFSTLQNARLEAELCLAKEKHKEKMRYLKEEKMNELEDMRSKLLQTKQRANENEAEYLLKIERLSRLAASQELDYDKALERIDELNTNFRSQTDQTNTYKRVIEGHIDRHKEIHKQIQQDNQPYASNLINFFNNLKNKVTYDLEEISSREKIRSSYGSNYNSGSGGYNRQLLLMLHEANNICEACDSDVRYTRDYDGDGGMVIKVSKGGTCTYWTADKFQTRLKMMRDKYQTGEDKIEFYDVTDEWLEDSIHKNALPKNSTKKINLDITIEDCDVSFNESFIFPRHNSKRISYDKQPALNTISEEVNTGNNNNTNNKLNITNNNDNKHNNNNNDNKNNSNNNNSEGSNTYHLCHKLLDFSISCFKEVSQTCTYADVILNSLNNILSSTHSILSKQPLVSDRLFLLVQSFISLQFAVSHWMSTLNTDKLDVVTKAKNKLLCSVQSLGSYIRSLLQALERDDAGKVEELQRLVATTVFDAASLCGKTSLVCRLNITSFDEGGLDLDDQLKNSFIKGCNMLAEEALCAALEEVHESRNKYEAMFRNARSPFKIGNKTSELLKATMFTVSSAHVLLNKLKRLQTQLTHNEDNDKSFRSHHSLNHSKQQTTHNTTLPTNDFYCSVYKRCLSLCIEFSGVVDCSIQLMHMVAMVVKDEKISVDSDKMKILLKNLTDHVNNIYSKGSVISPLEKENDSGLNNRMNSKECDLNASILDGVINNEQESALEEVVTRMRNALYNLSFIAS